MNSVNLIGRVTKDPESFELEGAKMLTRCTIAVDNGDKTSFIPLAMFGKVAEAVSKYVRKGHLIGITGHLNQKTYSNAEGVKKSSIEVVCESVDFLEKKPEESKDEKPKKKKN